MPSAMGMAMCSPDACTLAMRTCEAWARGFAVCPPLLWCARSALKRRQFASLFGHLIQARARRASGSFGGGLRAVHGRSMGEPTVRRALVAAACRLSTTDNFNNPRQLVRIDGTPVIIHILRGLRGAGITRVVITLGHAADLLAKVVLAESFGSMTVELVWCEESSWKRGHASNILAARSVFPEEEPFLIVMSDHIFDPRLFRRYRLLARSCPYVP